MADDSGRKLRRLHALAAMAAADGRVHPNERRLLETVCEAWELPPGELDRALAAGAGGALRVSIPADDAARRDLLTWLVEVAAADGEVVAAERRVLSKIAEKLGALGELEPLIASALRSARQSTASPDPPAEEGARVPARHVAPDGVPLEWEVGDVILDRYEVVRTFDGGMGRVCRVRHRDWGVDLAVKSPLAPELMTPNGAQAFFREAEAWIELEMHPNIVTCYYVRELGGVPRLFAEYVEGGTLFDWIRERRLYEGDAEAALERVLDVAIQFAWGLSHAHERGLVHLDVKPGNVMMTPGGAAKLTDFGIAKLGNTGAGPVRAGAPGAPGVTGTLLVSRGALTPGYCSPEQAAGSPQLTRGTDVWSWAVSILHMFTGDMTWRTGPAAEGALRECLARAPAPGQPRLPALVGELLGACLSAGPSARPRMREVSARLVEIHERVLGRAYGRSAPEAIESRLEDLNDRAVSYFELGRPDDAMTLLRQAREVEPDAVEPVYNEVLAWGTPAANDDDLLDRLSLIRADPRDRHHRARLSLALGLLHERRGDAPRALEAIEAMPAGAVEATELARLARAARSGLDSWPCYLRTIDTPDRIVTGVVVAPDGQRVACAGDGGVLRVFRVSDGVHLSDLGHPGPSIHAVACSESQNRALTANVAGTLTLWDLEAEADQHVSRWSAGVDVAALALSPSGSNATVLTPTGELVTWETASGRLIGRQRELMGKALRCLAYSADDEVLTGGDEGLYRLRVPCGAHVRLARRASTLATDSRCGAVLAYEGGVTLWTGATTRDLAGHSEEVRCLSFLGHSITSPHIASASRSELRVWRSESGGCLRTFVHPRRWTEEQKAEHTRALFQTLRSAPSLLPLLLANLGRHDTYEQRRLLRLLRGQGLSDLLSDVVAQTYMRHEQRMRTDGGGGLDIALVFRVASEMTRKLAGFPPGFSALAASEDGALAVTGSTDGKLDVFRLVPTQLDVSKGRPLLARSHASSYEERALQDAVVRSKVSGVRESLGTGAIRLGTLELLAQLTATCGWRSRRVHEIWGECDVRARRSSISEVRRVDGFNAMEGTRAVTAMAWDADDERLAIALEDDVLVYDLGSRKVIRRLVRAHRIDTDGDGEVVGVGLRPGGRELLTLGGDRWLRLWDLESGACIREMRGHPATVTCGAIDVTCRIAVSGSAAGDVRVWRTSEQSAVCVPRQRGPAIRSAAISGAGRLAAWIDAEGALQVWDVVESRQRHEVRLDPKVRAWSLTIDGTGESMIVARHPGAIVVVDAGSGRSTTLGEPTSTPVEAHELGAMEITPDGRFLLVGAPSFEVWDLESSRRVLTAEGLSLEGHICMSPDGRRLVGRTGRRFATFDLRWELTTPDPEDVSRPRWPEVLAAFVFQSCELEDASFLVKRAPSWAPHEILAQVRAVARRSGFGWTEDRTLLEWFNRSVAAIVRGAGRQQTRPERRKRIRWDEIESDGS